MVTTWSNIISVLYFCEIILMIFIFDINQVILTAKLIVAAFEIVKNHH